MSVNSTSSSTATSTSIPVSPSAGWPDFSGITTTYSNQLAWNRDTHACGRPAPDLGLTVVCSLYSGQAHMTDVGFAFEAYKNCCPVDVNRSNLWMAEERCGVFCYTSDLTLALAFDQCAIDTSKVVGNKTLMMGSCGYIDYVALKKGVSAASRESGVRLFRLIVGSLILTTVMMST